MKIADYTEQEYVCVDNLSKDVRFDVVKYRDAFKVEVSGGYYVGCKNLLNKVYRIYEKFLQYHSSVQAGDCIVKEVLNRIPTDMGIEDVLNLDFEDAILGLKSVFKDDSDVSYLLSDENIVFKILYVIERYFLLSSVYCFFLIVVLLKYVDLYSCIVLFQPKWFRSLKIDGVEDFTIDYFKVLEWLDEQLHKEIVVFDDESLLEYYPYLTKEQASFYLSHRKSGCYYTIEKYTIFNEVCYETARLHLEQLVNMGWYKKQKVGKKFVYSV